MPGLDGRVFALAGHDAKKVYNQLHDDDDDGDDYDDDGVG